MVPPATEQLDRIVRDCRARRARVRRRALRELVLVGDSSMLPVAMRGLDDHAMTVRKRAVWAVRKLGGEAVVPRLAGALADPHADVRQAAIFNLGRLAHPDAVDGLLSVLDDRELGWRAATAVVDCGPTGVRGLLDALDDHERAMAAAMGLAHSSPPVPEGLDALLAVLDGGPPRAWVPAAIAVGRVGPEAERAIPVLCRALREASDGLDRCGVASRVLARIGTPPCVDALVDAASRDDPVWIQGALGLGHLGAKGQPGVGALIDKALRGDSESHWAIEALGWIGSADAVEPLVTIAERSSQYVGELAIAALGRIGDPRATPCLLAALPRRAARAAVALGRLDTIDEVLPEIERQLSAELSPRDAAIVARVLAGRGCASEPVRRALQVCWQLEDIEALAQIDRFPPRAWDCVFSGLVRQIAKLRNEHRRRARYETMQIEPATLASAVIVGRIIAVVSDEEDDAPTDFRERYHDKLLEAQDALLSIRPWVLGPSASWLWANAPNDYDGHEVDRAVERIEAVVGEPVDAST